MKRFFIILTLFLFMLNPVFSAGSLITQDLTVSSKDGFVIKASLEYPKDKNKREYKTVVLLHALGYTSQWWETLPQDLLDEGYAVLKIDLRGHGKSIYNSRLGRISWKNMTNSGFEKYPDDVISVLEQVRSENSKKTFFNDWAIVGSDIGASTAILVAEKISYKPKTIVMLSPGVNLKGLYLPVKFAQLDNVDVFSITGKNDIAGKTAEEYLKKFSQATFTSYVSEAASNGMLMLKHERALSKIITTWIKQYL